MNDVQKSGFHFTKMLKMIIMKDSIKRVKMLNPLKFGVSTLV